MPAGVTIFSPYGISPQGHARARPDARGRGASARGTGPALARCGNGMPFAYTTNLAEVRTLAEKHARMAGLPDDRIADFVIAVSEVAGNTVRHARSPGFMEIWQHGDEIVCEIRDAGVIADPRAGRRPPPPEASGGHGLWIVYQVCDHVDLRSDENGTVIRLHMALPRSPASEG